MKRIDKQIMATILSTVGFVLVVIITGVIVVNSLYGYMKDTVKVGNFLVDYSSESIVKGKLEILSNVEGLNTKSYELTITNNGKEVDEYYLYVKDKDGKELPENLVVSFNSFVTKKISGYATDEDYYIIYDGKIEPGYSATHSLKFWWQYTSDASIADQEVEIEFGIIDK